MLLIASSLLLLAEWAGSRDLSVRARHRQNLILAFAGLIAFLTLAILTAFGIPDRDVLRLVLSILGVVAAALMIFSEFDNLRNAS